MRKKIKYRSNKKLSKIKKKMSGGAGGGRESTKNMISKYHNLLWKMKYPKLTLVKAITKELKKKVTTSASSNEEEEEMVNCYKKKPAIIHSKDGNITHTVQRDWKQSGINLKVYDTEKTNRLRKYQDPHCEIVPSLMRRKKVWGGESDHDPDGEYGGEWMEDEVEDDIVGTESTGARDTARKYPNYIQEFYNYKPNSTVSKLVNNNKVLTFRTHTLGKIQLDWNETHVHKGWNADVDISVKKGDIVEILRRSKDKRWREAWTEMWEKIPFDKGLWRGWFHVRKVGGDGDVGLVPCTWVNPIL